MVIVYIFELHVFMITFLWGVGTFCFSLCVCFLFLIFAKYFFLGV